ncbi:MAG: hypothetical protein HY606_14675 [Planctomycetes bacterium]|nr:hypothetical protein [Planctomycetota bacterium]
MHKKSGKGLIILFLLIALLGAVTYFILLPYYFRYELMKKVDLLTAKDEFTKAIKTIDSRTDIPKAMLYELSESVINKAKAQWSYRRDQVRMFLLNRNLDDAKKTFEATKSMLSNLARSVDLEIAQFESLLGRIATIEDISRYESEIRREFSNNSTATSSTQPDEKQGETKEPSTVQETPTPTEDTQSSSYELDVSILRKSCNNVTLNRENKDLYRHYLVRTLSLEKEIMGKYSDKLDSEFFLIRKQISDEKKMIGSKTNLQKMLEDEMDTLSKEIQSDKQKLKENPKDTALSVNIQKEEADFKSILNYYKVEFPKASHKKFEEKIK